ncbi:hypothetical protein DY000_02021195 [Brassica cretica]|uniref:F-box associated domain-containing protein n=1 Tax=Brassica cretica TaxID=69181 RepID=A0ABQ7E1I5_BRACR|nr:hypothetical protein DY000_02021195 [Brassica cretica]
MESAHLGKRAWEVSLGRTLSAPNIICSSPYPLKTISSLLSPIYPLKTINLSFDSFGTDGAWRRVAARTVTGGHLCLVSFSRFAAIPSVSFPFDIFLWKNGEKVERWVEVAVCFLGYGWRSIFSFRSRPAFSVREEERHGVLSWVSTVRCSGPGGSRLRRVSLVGFLNLSVLLLAWCVLVGFSTTAASS